MTINRTTPWKKNDDNMKSNNHDNKTINLFSCNQMHANNKRQTCIETDYTSSFGTEKHRKLIIYRKND